VAQVPDDFLRPLVADAGRERVMRHRGAYEAFLWKRLKAPRPFLPQPPPDGDVPMNTAGGAAGVSPASNTVVLAIPVEVMNVLEGTTALRERRSA
jgi:hypothetical protein